MIVLGIFPGSCVIILLILLLLSGCLATDNAMVVLAKGLEGTYNIE